MTNDERNPNNESRKHVVFRGFSDFVLLSSFVIRHSDFGLERTFGTIVGNFVERV